VLLVNVMDKCLLVHVRMWVCLKVVLCIMVFELGTLCMYGHGRKVYSNRIVVMHRVVSQSMNAASKLRNSALTQGDKLTMPKMLAQGFIICLGGDHDVGNIDNSHQ